MAKEIELKLALAEHGWPAFSRHPLLREAIAAPHRQSLRNLYFDTPDLALKRQRVALRLRQTGRRWVQTVKCAAAARAGLSARPEWETPFDGHFDFSAVDDEAVRAELESLRDRGALATVFDTNFERREWRFAAEGGEVLLMADRGHIISGEHRETISEIELEIAGGASVPALLDIAARLAERLPLRAESRSKAQRGYELMAGSTPVAVRASRSPLSAEATPDEAFKAIALDCIAHYQANEHGALTSEAPEFVHQMRVALRRLRSALRVFGPALPEGVADGLTGRLRALAGDLGELRDRDVLHEELLSPALVAHRSAGLKKLERHLAAARSQTRDRVLIALQDGRQARLMIALLQTLHAAPPAEHRLSLQALARKRLARARSRVAAAVDHARGGDIAALHALRIDVKRLRYAVEFFMPLLPHKKAQRTLALLTEAQEKLGFINDLSQAGPRLLLAADGDAAMLRAVSQIAALHMPRYRQIIDHAPKLLRTLSRLPKLN
ncbi:CYTH and CHAD domain-containing protein [Methyloversatilis thermotolerans]|uniref:CYTH and CHAD domain-containing protein n=1 Tax=Methyloversatilis thermotolerans TaxID=1346290 RepID=UPI0004776EA9|nr:CYTH and CHAD domain-containing protein [Methyloversatilis thermotolerans]